MTEQNYLIWSSSGHARVTGDVILGNGDNVVF